MSGISRLSGDRQGDPLTFRAERDVVQEGFFRDLYPGYHDCMWTLTVFLFLNGAWVPGDEADGWGSVTYETRQECFERASFSQSVAAAMPEHYPSMRFECRQVQP